jgi:NACalpha-BTF3-like transcription factor
LGDQCDLFGVAGIIKPALVVAGISEPDLTSGISQPATSLWAVDVGGDGGKGAVVWDGKEHRKFSSFMECVQAAPLAGIALIHAERSFANYSVEARPDIIGEAEGSGIDIKTINPIQTSRMRKALGLEKSDEVDAQVIYRLASDHRIHFKKATVVETEYKDMAQELYTYYALQLRRTGLTQTIADVFNGLVGSIDIAPHAVNLVNTNGKISKSAVAAVAFATMNTRNRGDAERLMGLYGNGHACILRSEIYHWCWRFRRKSGNTTLSSFRRSLRWVRSQVNNNRKHFLKHVPEILMK